MDKLIVILVPGRDDRAFYKRFIMHVANSLNLEFSDLDRSGHESEKSAVLNKIVKGWDKRKGTQLLDLRRSSSVKLYSSLYKSHAMGYVTIIPTEGNVSRAGAILLKYQASLSNPSIDLLVLIDDAEEMTFNARLQSFYNSLTYTSSIDVDALISRGSYHYLYKLRRPRNIILLLIVQGLEQFTIVPKHAIEDFIFYLYHENTGKIKEALSKCPRTLRIDTMDRYAHKKLALLIALEQCYTRIEELLARDIDNGRLLKLQHEHDGLRTLTITLKQLLNTQT